MKAITQDRYGTADVMELAEIETPGVVDGQVLVRVRAASVNPVDWHIMRGKPFVVRLVYGLHKPKSRVRGVDVSGVVEAIGAGVTELQAGDEVLGWCHGAFAEYAAAEATRLVHKPPHVTHDLAAAVPLAALTALQGLRDKGQIQAGHSVLIIGASGGVGTFAVQIAKAFGTEVTGVCSGRNVEMVRSIGADHVIDYTQEDFTKSGRRYDLIFQLAGTASPFKLRRVLTRSGRLVLSSGTGRMAGIDRTLKALAMTPFVSQKLVTWVASENQEDLAALKELMESGAIKAVIDRTYGLSDVPEAIRYVEDGHTQGKVVVSIG